MRNYLFRGVQVVWKELLFLAEEPNNQLERHDLRRLARFGSEFLRSGIYLQRSYQPSGFHACCLDICIRRHDRVAGDDAISDALFPVG